jgi:hypothetical protein
MCSLLRLLLLPDSCLSIGLLLKDGWVEWRQGTMLSSNYVTIIGRMASACILTALLP